MALPIPAALATRRVRHPEMEPRVATPQFVPNWNSVTMDITIPAAPAIPIAPDQGDHRSVVMALSAPNSILR